MFVGVKVADSSFAPRYVFKEIDMKKPLQRFNVWHLEAR